MYLVGTLRARTDLRVFHFEPGRTRPFDPLRKKPAKITSGGFTANSRHVGPPRVPSGLLGNQRLETVPECLLANFTPQHMEHHRGLLVADSIVSLIVLPAKLINGVIVFWPDIGRVAQEHHPSLLACFTQPT